jgi:hypothetical protein
MAIGVIRGPWAGFNERGLTDGVAKIDQAFSVNCSARDFLVELAPTAAQEPAAVQETPRRSLEMLWVGLDGD